MKILRGMTVPHIWIDETAFVKYIEYMYNAMAPAFSKASESAQASGSPYAILLSTTPSSLDVPDGKFFHNTIMGMACNFDERFYDWYFEKGIEWLKEYITSNSQNDMVYIEYSYKELGKDETWLKRQIRSLNNNMALVKREIFLEWTLSSDDSLFDEEELTEIAGYADKDYIAKLLIHDKYTLHLTKHPSNMLRKNYLIGLDIAGGLGRDKTALTIVDPLDYSMVGVLYSNRLGAVELVDVVIEILTRYFPKAIVVPELNHTGQTFVEMILKDHPRFEKNMFYTIKERRVEKIVDTSTMIDFGRAKKQTTKREVRKYGITTTTKTRQIMIEEILFNFLEHRPEVFNNRDIFNELKTLERKKNGKIEHSDNGYDDILFSYLVVIYAMLYEQRSMKRFLKNIYDDENVVEMTEEERYRRLEKNNRVSKYRDIIQDNLALGELGDELYKNGLLDEKIDIVEDEKIKKSNFNKMRNLFRG